MKVDQYQIYFECIGYDAVVREFFQKYYAKLVLDYPAIALLLIFTVVGFFGYHAPQFRLDASSESLSLENDQALKYYRSIAARYGSNDYLLITYTPESDLFSAEILKELYDLRTDLDELERVESIISIVDVPLINSPPLTLDELSHGIPNLLSPQTDLTMARKELLASPIYADLLISQDVGTTALLVSFKENGELLKLIQKRDQLREKSWGSALSGNEARLLKLTEKEYSRHNALAQLQQQQDIASVRVILDHYRDKAKIHLGGVPMIVADSIDYISKDLRIFGIAILCFLVVLLTVISRVARWVFLSMLSCFCVGLSMIGFMGLMDWPATIVSANFVSLLLIFTLSFCVHQIVRYREFHEEKPEATQRELVRDTILDISVPCFYMAFTTAIGFASLAVSDIRPVIDFGWMMTIGIGFSFFISFIIFPAALMFLKPSHPPVQYDFTGSITRFFVRIIKSHGKPILIIFAVLMGLSIWGINQLYVQNRFIDYYKQDTEIYQGMEMIDRKLGGTTPLDVIIDAPAGFIQGQAQERAYLEEEGFWIEDSGPKIVEGYWVGEASQKQVAAIHDYLDGLEESGKVLSFHSTAQLLKDLDEERSLNRQYLGVLYQKLPDSVRNILFDPYLSEDGNQLRFSLRVYESKQGQDREALVQKIRDYLTQDLELEANQVHLTGMMVLYNNVLQTLFESQILTIGVVFVTMFLIFLLLFRSFKVAAVAIVPNITIVALVLGLIGWLGIPLDIMTITIAAICFGMADDNTIHYIHRFRQEYAKHGDYWRAARESHNTIGRAMYYTSITVMFGFSILAFSNFMPTIYFGLLTGFSALVALLANLALLPLILIFFKPLGKHDTR
ncbi:MAG: MMPL family transporter [Rickettsiales bacterium]|nr:MMPL family transporter [Rickettsiales bacterium]